MAVTASQSTLSGLPRRLVQDGIVSEEVILQAADAARKAKEPLVAYLVHNEMADSRAIAVAASHEFGVPLMDLDAIEIDLETLRAVDQKLLNKHKVLPLVKRGQRLFLGISDPTNLQAIDDVKFQTSLRIDPVVVEEAKLQERISKALEAMDTTMSSLDDDDFDLENLDVSGGDDREDEASPKTTSKTRQWFVLSTRCCSMPSNVVHLTFTSNPMKRFFESEPDWTAFCRKLHNHR